MCFLDQKIKEFAETKSPHVILSNKTFNDIKLNTIMLTRPRIENISNNRNIFYDIKWMGDNVKMKVNGKIITLICRHASVTLLSYLLQFMR